MGGIELPWHLLAFASPVRDWRLAKENTEATDQSEGDSVLPADPDVPSTRSPIVGLASQAMPGESAGASVERPWRVQAGHQERENASLQLVLTANHRRSRTDQRIQNILM